MTVKKVYVYVFVCSGCGNKIEMKTMPPSTDKVIHLSRDCQEGEYVFKGKKVKHYEQD